MALFSPAYSNDFVKEGLYSVIPPEFSQTRDEVDPDHECFYEEILVEKISNMFTVPYRLRAPFSIIPWQDGLMSPDFQ